jgi:hypothetical protein
VVAVVGYIDVLGDERVGAIVSSVVKFTEDLSPSHIKKNSENHTIFK